MTHTEVNAHSLCTDNGNRVRTKNTFLRSLALLCSILFIFSEPSLFISESFKMVFMVFIGILSGMKQRIPKISVGFCLLNSVLVKSQ